ncbi:hypothetical protein K1719_044793 [Acacia pycnantha]|nr:hypothetical protein K1719_044793 [Acacia pycnantha]
MQILHGVWMSFKRFLNLVGGCFPSSMMLIQLMLDTNENVFEEAFAEHEEKFNGNTKKVQNWKNVLFEISNLAGWDTRGRHEAELTKDIIAEVSTYLHSKLPSYDDNLVGIESRVHDMEAILEIGLDDKRGVGIWGMGGVGGLPLALKVLGSYFHKRSEAEWIDALNRMKQVHPHKSILQVLKISYDGLDENEQTIFLDVVCFFKHCVKEVTQILKSCGLHPTIGIKVLIEKALLVETKDCKLEMHDLIEEMGRYIVLQESPNDVCKRSRLREFKDIKEVLKNNKGSEAIQAIAMQDNYENQDRIKVHRKAFSKMSRLRLLLLNCPTEVPTGLKKLSCALKFVQWPLFPLEALPLPLDELVHIEMQCSNIRQLWNGIKSLNHLKCTSLVKVHDSLRELKELVEVDLHGCENLKSLPSKLETNSLRKLDLEISLQSCQRGDKIPSWFDPNIKHYGEPGLGECEIEVDVPSNFRDSKWSGIIVCLHINKPFGWIYWSSKAPEDDKYNGREVILGRLGLDRDDDDIFCVMVLEFNQKTCWQHLRGDNNSLHILLPSDFSIKILGYGWRVICKEDIQEWCHANDFNQPQHASPSEVKISSALLGKVLRGSRSSALLGKVLRVV